jgi:transposase
MLGKDDTRYYFRVFSVNFVLNGMSAARVAEIAGVSRSTVSGWVKTVDEHGFDALKQLNKMDVPRNSVMHKKLK